MTSVTISYYTTEGKAYANQLQNPGPEPCSRMPLHPKTPHIEGLKWVRLDDLAYNNYVTSGWLDAYYHGKWWSGVEVFRMPKWVDHGYHKGRHIIG